MMMNQLFVERILSRYCNDECFYHTREHIVRMLEGFEEFRPEFVEEIQRIAEAVILFHDIVYVPGAKDNEEKSAEAAKQELIACGWTMNHANAVYDLILTTEPFTKYEPVFDDFIETEYEKYHLSYLIDVIHDLDWSGFRDFELMKKNDGKILCEAEMIGQMDEDSILKGQYAFYKQLLEYVEKKGHLYRTSALSDDFTEQSVKENLKKMIELKGSTLPKASVAQDTYF